MSASKSSVSFWKSFGPGVLFAGAAIGTSHLVQSTRAGAMFGLGLLLVVILTNFFKYPAYRFGPQYAASTGRSLIQGYRRLGAWVVAFYLLIELGIIAIIIAATAVTTGAILLGVFEWSLDPRHVGVGLIALAVVALVTGGYRLLDRSTKVFVVVLTLATLVATLLSLPKIQWDFTPVSLSTSDLQTFGFVIALMGFMPAGMELSAIQSLWVVAKAKSSGQVLSTRLTILDFNVGYIMSALLAICFLLMGTAVLHSAGESPAQGAAAFAQQVISLFTAGLGQWSGTLVGVSALFVMFTTLTTVLDGMPRLVAACLLSLKESNPNVAIDVEGSSVLRGAMIVLAIAGALVLLFFMSSFQAFIDFVTITAFVVAPITATLNHLVITAEDVPPASRPGPILKTWSLLGILLMLGLALAYLYARFLV